MEGGWDCPKDTECEMRGVIMWVAQHHQGEVEWEEL